MDPPGPRPRELDARLGAFADIDLAVAWDLAEDGGFARLVASGIAPAPAGHGHSVRVDAEGLAPDHVYYYRFRLGPWTSRTGRTRTAPAPEAPRPSWWWSRPRARTSRPSTTAPIAI